jgi:mannosyl alpha-1,6-glycoprotein beta-1,6-N-acetyl-glucosaminyltransferase isozyme B
MDDMIFSHYDFVFTDITGAKMIRAMSSQMFARVKCRLRVVDSFGTSKFFNHAVIAEKTGYVNPWGRLALPSLQQYMTFYPHSPDNFHAGFVVYKNESEELDIFERRNTALIYAKKKAFLAGNEIFLKIVSVRDWFFTLLSTFQG